MMVGRACAHACAPARGGRLLAAAFFCAAAGVFQAPLALGQSTPAHVCGIFQTGWTGLATKGEALIMADFKASLRRTFGDGTPWAQSTNANACVFDKEMAERKAELDKLAKGLRSNGCKHVILMGHSCGGKTILTYADALKAAYAIAHMPAGGGDRKAPATVIWSPNDLAANHAHRSSSASAKFFGGSKSVEVSQKTAATCCTNTQSVPLTKSWCRFPSYGACHMIRPTTEINSAMSRAKSSIQSANQQLSKQPTRRPTAQQNTKRPSTSRSSGSTSTTRQPTEQLTTQQVSKQPTRRPTTPQNTKRPTYGFAPRSWRQPTFLFSAKCLGSPTVRWLLLPSSSGACSKGEDGKSAKGTCSADSTRLLFNTFDRGDCSGPVTDTGWLAMSEVHKYLRGQCATWRGPGLSEPQTIGGLKDGVAVSSRPDRPLVAGVDYPRCASPPGNGGTAAAADTSRSASENNESEDVGGGAGVVSIILVLLFLLVVLIALAFAENAYLESRYLAPVHNKVVAVLRAVTARRAKSKAQMRPALQSVDEEAAQIKDIAKKGNAKQGSSRCSNCTVSSASRSVQFFSFSVTHSVGAHNHVVCYLCRWVQQTEGRGLDGCVIMTALQAVTLG